MGGLRLEFHAKSARMEMRPNTAPCMAGRTWTKVAQNAGSIKMSKHKSVARTLKQAQKLAGYHCKDVEEMTLDIGRQMMRDQSEWLDAQMKDLLPPPLYAAGKAGEMEKEIGEYLQKHQIRIVFIPDRMVVRILIGERVHSQFVPTFTVDGEPVELHQQQNPLDGSQN